MLTGIYQIDEETYHADPCSEPSLSNSIACTLLTQSPKHAWLKHPRLNTSHKPDESARFDIGTAAHALLLEGSAAKICVVEADDWRTKAAKEQRDMARASGMTPILAKNNYALNSMVNAAKEYIATSELRGVFDQGKPEQTLIWKDDGIWCRSRLDWLSDDRKIILDYKTCESAEPEAFIRHISRMQYDLQAAFYLRGLARQNEFTSLTKFVFLAQEIEAPYACSLIGLSNHLLDIAASKVDRAISLWKECLTTNKWPAYPTRICYAEPTAWQMAEHERNLEEM